MQRYLINTIKNHRCSSYICSRASLFHLFPSPLLRSNTKALALKANVNPKRIGPGNMGEEERAIVHGHACLMSSVKKALDFDKEMTKLNAAHKLGLYADVVIPLKANLPSKKSARATALNIQQCNFGRRHRLFYSDGSSTTIPKVNSASLTVEHISVIPSGIGVAYQRKRDEHWNVSSTPGNRGRDTVFTEIAAIAHALAIAMAERALYLDDNKKHSNGKARWSKVTILSDCTHALRKIRKLLESAIADARLISDPLLRQIVTMLQYFHFNGVQVELRWVSGHSGVEGNCRANAAARYAASHQDVGMLLPEGLNWDTEPLSNDVKTHGPQQQNMSPKRKG